MFVFWKWHTQTHWTKQTEKKTELKPVFFRMTSISDDLYFCPRNLLGEKIKVKNGDGRKKEGQQIRQHVTRFDRSSSFFLLLYFVTFTFCYNVDLVTQPSIKLRKNT